MIKNSVALEASRGFASAKVSNFSRLKRLTNFMGLFTPNNRIENCDFDPDF